MPTWPSGAAYTVWGSWEASAASRYIKRYKYSGNLDMQYSKVRIGSKGEADYLRQSNFQIGVDPLAGPQGQPWSTFLRVGQLRHQRLQPLFGHQPQRHALDPDQLLDFLLEELAGTPFSLSANMAVSQNSQNKTSPSPCRPWCSTSRASTRSSARSGRARSAGTRRFRCSIRVR